MTVVWTIGHSTRPVEALVELLAATRIATLVDVRTVPRSRRNPQFSQEALAAALRRAGVRYAHAPALGGLRTPRRDSPNTAWRNESFRGYADHMATPEFRDALDALVARAGTERVAIMCAEAVPWRCHRSLIADALTARDVEVRHIVSAAEPEPHRPTAFARIEDGEVTYPGDATLFEG